MLIMFILFSCYDLASLGQLAGDLKIEVAIVQIIMFRPKPAQFERTKSAANPLVVLASPQQSLYISQRDAI